MPLLLALPLLALSDNAIAGEIKLRWNANTEENLKGYKLHWGTESKNYSNSKDVGNVTEYRITGLTDGVKYYFAATAYNDNEEDNESKFSHEISHTIGQALDPVPTPACCIKVETNCDIIIDNKDDETTASGTWQESSGPNPYKESSLWSMTSGSEFKFLADITGKANVHLWWTTQTTFNIDRCKNVKVEIHSLLELIDTVEVDQTLNGGKWNHIGEYDFNGSSQVVFKVGDQRCSVSVDAVKFERN